MNIGRCDVRGKRRWSIVPSALSQNINKDLGCHEFLRRGAYCLTVTLKHRLRRLAPGLAPRAALEKLATIQMLDVVFPTTDGRCLIMPRYTEPDPDQALLLPQLNLALPQQPPPRIAAQTSDPPAIPLKM